MLSRGCADADAAQTKRGNQKQISIHQALPTGNRNTVFIVKACRYRYFRARLAAGFAPSK
jgi:hypothetical protein